MGKQKKVEIKIDAEVYAKVSELFKERKITLDAFIHLQLVAACNTRARASMQLAARMPFGKYAGVPIEDIVRGDLAYILYLIGNNAKFDDDVLALVSELSQ